VRQPRVSQSGSSESPQPRTAPHVPLWVGALVGNAPLSARLNALFGGATAANWLFLTAIAIGFFHGWIKYKYTGLVSTFAFDLPLTMALALALTGAAKDSWFPRDNPVATQLKVLCGVAVAYALIPLGVPLLAALAAFRAWVVIPLVFLLGYHVIRSVRQIEILLFLVMALCAITVYFGARQTPEEIRAMMAANPDLARRLSGTFFANADGGGGLRAFSTFVSAGAFGGTLSTGGILAFAYLTQPKVKPMLRLLYAVVLGLCLYGINLSGARTAIAMLMMGIIATAWSRERLVSFVAIPGAVLSVLGLGALMDSARLERFSTILNPAEWWGRLSIVILPGIASLSDLPLGGGLGRSGHGVPYIFGSILPPWDVRLVDGDLGRIAVDFGIPGLVFFGALFFVGIRESVRWMLRFRNTSLQILSICSGAVFVIAVVNVGTGSPFLGVPGGALTWFFLGAMSRLANLHSLLVKVNPANVWSDPRLIPFFASVPVPAQAPTDLPEVAAVETPPRRRMLYSMASSEPGLPARPSHMGKTRRLFGRKADNQ
jgi:hypothetical protein